MSRLSPMTQQLLNSSLCALVSLSFNFHIPFSKLFYLFILRERGREGQKHWCARETPLVASCTCPNQGLGGDLELNRQRFPFPLWDKAKQTELPPELHHLSYTTWATPPEPYRPTCLRVIVEPAPMMQHSLRCFLAPFNSLLSNCLIY